jgi:aryl-alcohol dehydrogenase-like predicted oxidoreductase
MSEQTIPIAFSCGTGRKLTVSVEAMRKRRLGSSDLMVSEISLGSWLTYGGGVGREQAEACVAKAFELGIDLIDTANVYSRGKAEGTRATSDAIGGFMERALDQRLLERVQRLRPVADELGLSMAQLALAWVLREENVASAIIGASRPEQVEDNAAASGVELDAATLERIDEILGDSVSWEGPAS